MNNNQFYSTPQQGQYTYSQPQQYTYSQPITITMYNEVVQQCNNLQQQQNQQHLKLKV